MDCGCGSQTPCPCSGARRTQGETARTRSLGARGSIASTPRSVAAPGLPARLRPTRSGAPAIGTRPAVQVPAGFDGGAMTLRIPRAVMVQALFGEANAAVQAEALRLLQRVPAAELPLVEHLLGESPPSFRLDRLAEFVRSDPRLEAAEMTVAISPLRPTLRDPRPALSALVPTCLVNEFDPRWGTPPSAWHDIPLRFDASRGWYAFDRPEALRDAPRDPWGQPRWDPLDFSRVEDAYAASYALQPYKRSLGAPWEFRWILPIDRPPVCTTAPPTST